MDWLKSLEKRKIVDRILYIFGHSIGITDKDIIESFVTAKDMKTVVFYYDDEAFANQVSNMTAIIGKNEMINRTGGLNHTLEFREQTKSD